MLRSADLQVVSLGEPAFDSPLELSDGAGDGLGDFISEEIRVRNQAKIGPGVEPAVGQPDEPLSWELAGPRKKLYFDPRRNSAAIVTCGGLCPGLNNVIRSIYLELHHNYGLWRVLGLRNGYQGLNPQSGQPPIELTSSYVDHIHTLGGTCLGSSRGAQDPAIMVDFLQDQKIDILFCAGGDGTQRGAHAIFEEVRSRKAPIAVVGIPKTIDNDIPFVDRSFGYATALEEAEQALRGAHVEARAAPGGVGLVKLMGRHAGFIAVGAALANQDANFVLVPEVKFPLHGDHGFLAALEKRLDARDHAVVVVAEGAGQHLFEEKENPTAAEKDASGNVKLRDIGVFLRDAIRKHFQSRGKVVNVKYFDPSYLIRSVPANSTDRLLSDSMARNAVHAAMAGRTDMYIGHWNNEMIHVPISAARGRTKQIDLAGELWTSVLLATGQPRW